MCIQSTTSASGAASSSASGPPSLGGNGAQSEQREASAQAQVDEGGERQGTRAASGRQRGAASSARPSTSGTVNRRRPTTLRRVSPWFPACFLVRLGLVSGLTSREPATRSLHTQLALSRPLEEVFGFFADAANLEELTPPELCFRILTPLPIEMREGALIEYQLRLFGVPFGWRTRIALWQPPERFVDVQERGPYRLWEHTHRFEPIGGGTRVEDELRYALPFPPLAGLAHPVVRRQLDRIFAYRTAALAARFGTVDG